MSKFLNCDVIMSMVILFILANSVDPDEMPPYAAFHLVLHCLPKYLFTSIKELTVKVTFLFLPLLHYMFIVNQN